MIFNRQMLSPLFYREKHLHSQDIINQNITSLIPPNTEHKTPLTKRRIFSQIDILWGHRKTITYYLSTTYKNTQNTQCQSDSYLLIFDLHLQK